jgi:hypothetical protein
LLLSAMVIGGMDLNASMMTFDDNANSNEPA